MEVDVFVESSVVTIKRILSSSSGQSKWIYNNRVSSQREIKLLMASLKIDVENLCSFMPQDRVGKFAAYTHKERLQNTLKTIECNNSLAGFSSSSSYIDIAAEEDALDGKTNLYQVQLLLAKEEREKISLENDRTLKERDVAKLKQELEVRGSIGDSFHRYCFLSFWSIYCRVLNRKFAEPS